MSLSPVAGGNTELADFYAAQSLAIQREFECTEDGLTVLSRRSSLVDTVVSRLYDRFFPSGQGGAHNFCLVALGGYGRRELFPQSDIDLLFLVENSGDESPLRDAISAILRELWDVRLRVGHSVHTLAECGRLYRDNLEFNVSLLDCRYLAGDRQLYRCLHDDVVPHLVARDYSDMVSNLAEVTRQRHAEYGQTIFHLEPNIKEGPGGLRDYHVCRWLVQISELEKRKAWIVPEDLWPRALQAEVRLAFEFLCATRCFLHYLHERDENQLSYEAQAQASSRGIGRHPSAPLPAADWMRMHFRNVRCIHQLAARLLDDYAPAHDGVSGLFQSWRARLSNAEFNVLREKVYVRQPAAFRDDPSLIWRLFEMIARHGFDLSRDAERAVREAGARVKGAAVWENFRRVLVLPWAAKALREMNRLGVLCSLFPDFQVIDALVVRDFFHRYTVDEHTFMTIQNLHALGSWRRDSSERISPGGMWEEKLAEIFAEIEKPEILFLSLLFHDVGKGMPGSAHTQGSLQALDRAMDQLGLAAPDRDLARFLVARHLLMSATLQRRDIFDPETIREFAAKTETPEKLMMLALLTYSDIKSVNPEALTPWKTEMLWRLYAATANYLARNVDDDRVGLAAASPSPVEKMVPLLEGIAGREEVERFLKGFPRRYVAVHPPEQIARHFRLARQLGESAVQVDLRLGRTLNELTVIALDRPFLFASITGTLTAWGMSIVKAGAFANAAGIVMDTFRFTDVHRTLELNPSEGSRLKSDLIGVLQGQIELAKLMSGRIHPRSLRRPKVLVATQTRFDNTASSHSTLLELITHDRPGLLYEVASVLAESTCDIKIALIDTEGEKVIDVFYVTCSGRKLTPEMQESVRKALAARLRLPSLSS